MLCTTHSPPVDPPPPGSRAPPGGRTQQGSASAWLNQETGGELPLSFYMMSAATLLPVHQISTCILFLVAGGQCVFLRCLDSPRKDRKDPMFWWRHVFTFQHAPCLLNLQGPVLRTFQCWCVRYWRWGDDRHVTHSFTKEIRPFVILFYVISLLYLLKSWLYCFLEGEAGRASKKSMRTKPFWRSLVIWFFWVFPVKNDFNWLLYKKYKAACYDIWPLWEHVLVAAKSTMVLFYSISFIVRARFLINILSSDFSKAFILSFQSLPNISFVP